MTSHTQDKGVANPFGHTSPYNAIEAHEGTAQDEQNVRRIDGV